MTRFGPALGLDFETGALLSGARFTLVRGHAAAARTARSASSCSTR